MGFIRLTVQVRQNFQQHGARTGFLTQKPTCSLTNIYSKETNFTARIKVAMGPNPVFLIQQTYVLMCCLLRQHPTEARLLFFCTHSQLSAIQVFLR